MLLIIVTRELYERMKRKEKHKILKYTYDLSTTRTRSRLNIKPVFVFPGLVLALRLSNIYYPAKHMFDNNYTYI